jgi:hypothetical protein
MKVTQDDFTLFEVKIDGKKVSFKGVEIVEQGVEGLPIETKIKNDCTKEPVKELKAKFASFAKYAVDVIEDVDLHFALMECYVDSKDDNYREIYKNKLYSIYSVTSIKLKTVSKSLALEISGFRTTVKGEIVPFCTHAISMSDTTYGWEADLENDWHELKGMMYEYIYLNKHANDGGALPMV